MAERTQVIKDFPPNIDFIKEHLNLDGHQPVFAYGNVVYSPYSDEIPADMEIHERIHFQQQRAFISPEMWWMKYCMDAEFRKEMEVEAYAYQYDFLKRHIPAKIYSQALDDFATLLSSSLYNLGIAKFQALTLIRIKAKNI